MEHGQIKLMSVIWVVCFMIAASFLAFGAGTVSATKALMMNNFTLNASLIYQDGTYDGCLMGCDWMFERTDKEKRYVALQDCHRYCYQERKEHQ